MVSLFALLACSSNGPPPVLPNQVRVVVLGSGTPVPDPDRSGPSVAITLGDRAWLFDAGPGVVRRAAAAVQNGEIALRSENLDRVFLTHLHSDHTVGLPDLWLSPWVVGRDVPLQVHGPPGTASMVEHVSGAWAEDVRMRTQGTEQRGSQGAGIVAHEIDRPGRVYDRDGVTIDAVPVEHGQWKHAWGYRFQAGDRVVVISGDTAPSEAIVAACGGCDVLVHEVYSGDGLAAVTVPGQSYHPTFHTSGAELGGLAQRAGAKRLVLTHQLFFGAPEILLVGEVRRGGFEGELASASDLDVFVVP